jgi:hypothetical protein
VAAGCLGGDGAVLDPFDGRASSSSPQGSLIAGLCSLVATCAGNGKILIRSLSTRTGCPRTATFPKSPHR